jgi:hypothetical protein
MGKQFAECTYYIALRMRGTFLVRNVFAFMTSCVRTESGTS